MSKNKPVAGIKPSGVKIGTTITEEESDAYMSTYMRSAQEQAGMTAGFHGVNILPNLNLDLGFNIPKIDIEKWHENLPNLKKFQDFAGYTDKLSDIKAIESLGVVDTGIASVPNISNVGSSSYSGVVNHNAIPGGFQPLPMTGGGRKKLYQLSQFHGGLNKKSDPRDIADFECVTARNITVSNVGRIKLLGDCLNEDNSLKEFAAISLANLPGYGLFGFTSPVDQDGNNAGDNYILLTSDGDQVDALSANGGQDAGWIDMAGNDDNDVAHVFYAASNGVYVTDSNFSNTSNKTKAKIYTNRNDIHGDVAVSGWSAATSAPLIDSPNDGDGSAEVQYEALGSAGVTREQTSGSMTVMTHNTGTGTWDGTYEFYVSWLFDNGCENFKGRIEKI